MVSRKLLIASLALAGLASSEVAVARNSYCCNDANGRLACGDMLPAACQKRPYRILDGRGKVIKEVEAPLTAEQRTLREAADLRKQEEEKKVAEEKRRNQALLATYPNEKDIDAARGRALADLDKSAEDNQKRFEQAQKTKKKLDAEKEFYLKKPMPANVRKQIEENDKDIKVLQEAADKRKEQADAIRTRFEAEKSRYMELKYGKAPAAVATPAAADKRPR